MINRAVIVGRLVAEPELRYTPSNTAVLSFTVACNRSYVSKDGQRPTDFIDCVAWRNQAEFVSRYFHKGNAIGIEGRIETRMYQDKNGNNRKAVEVVVDNVSFVESKSASAGNSSSIPFPTEPPASAGAQPAASAPVTYANGDVDDFKEIDMDDDLPF
ncbi:single-stranded DNA-binding protein [Candidatus Soleaferrea massiliensis]|uniref:single-stranded DNA-binding protein n=1 Tax=Candidatus Soleaferrea massiliensis TaxID=1470354 RepID=UPI000590CCAB|nr:single-stranded DNA-binding protein [Candidatus Soleaferrea massiliensis]